MVSSRTPDFSIVVRTLNEAKFLPECLKKIEQQNYLGPVEVVLVDSGSTDDTVKIATDFGAKIVHISKAEFTFGRSLNFGCSASSGEILVLLSAHCIPDNENWLQDLVNQLLSKSQSTRMVGRYPAKVLVNFQKVWFSKSITLNSPQFLSLGIFVTTLILRFCELHGSGCVLMKT